LKGDGKMNITSKLKSHHHKLAEIKNRIEIAKENAKKENKTA